MTARKRSARSGTLGVVLSKAFALVRQTRMDQLAVADGRGPGRCRGPLAGEILAREGAAAVIHEDEYDDMLRDCEAREGRLSDWERTFIDSLTAWRAQGKPLTKKQAERLDEIWERVTS